MKVLFVCTGNICRSPFAEGIARKLARERGIEDVEFASAGTHVAGECATDDGVAVALEHGVDLASFAPRALTAELVAEADVVVAMAPHHLADGALAGAANARLLGAGEIRDPYQLGPAAYRRAYDEIEQAVTVLLDEIEAGARS